MNIIVYFNDWRTTAPIKIGILTCSLIRGKEVFSFAFDNDWLKNPMCRVLDPDLQLFRGAQYVDSHKDNFGLFADSSPDRWGRVLLDRREAILANEQQRDIRPLNESDYLLGVYDESRMGALRFKCTEDGQFLDARSDYSTPPFAAIRDLEYASWQLENEKDTSNSRWLKMLLAPGSSLGGARPKANVQDTNGHLWIAKFPSRQDRADMGAWEAVAMTLAQQCGIHTPQIDALRFDNQYHTFLSRRFDRDEQGRRIHFASAMTMLGYADGSNATDGVSYLEMAEWIMSNTHNVQENLTELWKRIVFNIAIGNSDDHLRNHGFLLDSNGWTLAPAYDLNPDEYSTALSLNITETDNRMNYQLALEVAPFFGLSVDKAQHILDSIRTHVAQWQKIATYYHIPREEQLRKTPAFHI